MKKLTQELLSKYFYYNETTGELFWKERCCANFPIFPRRKSWNTKFANREVGRKGSNGYLYTSFLCGDKVVRTSAHRIIYILHNNVIPNTVDHINGIRIDNRPCNLRDVSRSVNQRNQKLNARNKIGITGVSKKGDTGLFRVRISDINKNVITKYTRDFFEACCMRKSLENKLGYSLDHGVRS